MPDDPTTIETPPAESPSTEAPVTIAPDNPAARSVTIPSQPSAFPPIEISPANLSGIQGDAKFLHERYFVLRLQRDAIEAEMSRILNSLRQTTEGSTTSAPRPVWECRRCGHLWKGFWANRPPRGCPRCHSTGWHEDPRIAGRARKPSDPPNPNWYRRKQDGFKTRTYTPARNISDRLVPGLAPPPKLKDVLPPEPSLVATEAVRFGEEPAPPKEVKDEGTDS